MARPLDLDELLEHFTLADDELELLRNKGGATRLGFSLLLKYPESNEQANRIERYRLRPVRRILRAGLIAWVATGRSNEEIGQVLFINPATVRAHVGRAMSQLRAVLARSWSSSRCSQDSRSLAPTAARSIGGPAPASGSWPAWRSPPRSGR
jgi:DNA-directed RNA polymerase specialized sigma24 family protein